MVDTTGRIVYIAAALLHEYRQHMKCPNTL